MNIVGRIILWLFLGPILLPITVISAGVRLYKSDEKIMKDYRDGAKEKED